jgi:uncharacterized repeat protein (TIGR01451 family)
VPAVPNVRPENFDSLAARQDQGLIVEWSGPPAAQVGAPADYTVLVRNVASIPVHAVTVTVPLTGGMTVSGTRPESRSDGKLLVFALGDLLPRQEKTLQMRLTINSKGEATPRALVSFAKFASGTLHVRVREPKLVLKTAAPAKVVLGDSATFLLTVTNPGDGPAERVKIIANLPEGLEHAEGKQVHFELGNLAAGETRTLQMVCTARGGGRQLCAVSAEAWGNLGARDESAVEVLTPHLELQAAGPGVRYIDRKASYSIRVMNKSDIPAANVTVSELVPAGFKFVSATRGGNFDTATRTVTWFLGEMKPNQAGDLQLELLAVAAGQHQLKFAASTDRGGKVRVERELTTRVQDLSALLLEVKDTDDPVEVGRETTYELIVTNAGSKTETVVQVVCAIPDKTEFKMADGPARYHAEGNIIVFEPLAKLAPKSDALFRIRVKALAPGDVRFKARVTSANVVEPVIQIEPTQIYADQAQ